MAGGTPCVWITGSEDETCKAEFWSFFIRRGTTLGMIAREYAMTHEELLQFVGGFSLDAGAQAFYDWLGEWIRMSLEPRPPAISPV